MSQKRFWKTYTIISIVFMSCIAWFFGKNVSIKLMLGFATHLMTVASIIFGIVGAWIAIIWNNRNMESVKFLRTIIFISFIVICCSLLTQFLYPLLVGIPVLSQGNIIIWLRKCIVLFFGMLFAFLIAALLYAALALDFFSFEDDIEKQSKVDYADYLSRQKSQMQKEMNDD